MSQIFSCFNFNCYANHSINFNPKTTLIVNLGEIFKENLSEREKKFQMFSLEEFKLYNGDNKTETIIFDGIYGSKKLDQIQTLNKKIFNCEQIYQIITDGKNFKKLNTIFIGSCYAATCFAEKVQEVFSLNNKKIVVIGSRYKVRNNYKTLEISSYKNNYSNKLSSRVKRLIALCENKLNNNQGKKIQNYSYLKYKIDKIYSSFKIANKKGMINKEFCEKSLKKLKFYKKECKKNNPYKAIDLQLLSSIHKDLKEFRLFMGSEEVIDLYDTHNPEWDQVYECFADIE